MGFFSSKSKQEEVKQETVNSMPNKEVPTSNDIIKTYQREF